MRIHPLIKEIFSWALSILIWLVIITVAIEVGYHFFRPSIYRNDKLLGWELQPDLNTKTVQHSLDGRAYSVEFTTDHDGLRTYGRNPKAEHRILALGDSFTGEPTASNDKMWFASLARALARETKTPLDDYYVWAGGAGGYGTYQNLLLSERLLQKIHPTLLILQFCTNDFSNNHFEWESQGIVRNQFMRRPFAKLEHLETPVYDETLLGKAYRSFIGESKVFNSLDSLVQRYQYQSYGGYGKPVSNETQLRVEAESVALTRQLLTALRGKFPDIPAVMINCDGDPAGLNSHWTGLAKDAGFVPLTAPSDFLHQAKSRDDKQVFNQDGAHLSEEGNQQFGAILASALVARDILP